MLYIPIYICKKRENNRRNKQGEIIARTIKSKHILFSTPQFGISFFFSRQHTLSFFYMNPFNRHTRRILNFYTDETDAHTDDYDNDDGGNQRTKLINRKN